MLRAVIFDMDDTLIDWSERTGDWTSTPKVYLKPIHDRLIADGYTLPTIEELAGIWIEQVKVAWGEVCGPEWIAPRQINILRETLKAAKLDVDGLDVEALQRLYAWFTPPGAKLFPDTVEVLQTLKQAGVKTGLLTNADLPMWMRDKELDWFKILEYIDIRLTAGDVGRLKPHPEPFQHAIKLLEVEPDEAVFVGDRWQDDVIGARAAGMRAIWIRRRSDTMPEEVIEALKPHAVIESLSELLTTFDRWYPRWRAEVFRQPN